MKNNLFIIITIFVIILAILASIYYNYQRKLVLAERENNKYKQYTETEISGSNLMTLINKVTDQNEKNNVQKDKNNRYIEDENSIVIDIKFLEAEDIFDMEAISALGSEEFVKNYNSMVFKCTKIEYNQKTKQIKYMLFEQI